MITGDQDRGVGSTTVILGSKQNGRCMAEMRQITHTHTHSLSLSLSLSLGGSDLHKFELYTPTPSSNKILLLFNQIR